MKKLIILSTIGLISFLPSESITYGVVERQMGIGIFICSIPARDFDTVCVFKTKKDFNSYAGPSIQQYVEGIQKPIDALAGKAVRKAKRKKNINAIITRDGITAVGVHFKTEVSAAMANRAEVEQYKGYYLFIQNKPLKKYKVVSKIKINNKIKLDDTGMYSLKTMVDSLISKYEHSGSSEKADGLITNSCIEAEFIKIIE